MTPDQAPQGWQWLAGLVGAIPVIAMAWSKFARNWSADRKAQVSDDAAGDVVEMMREELKRVQSHNAALVAAFEEAQLRIIELANVNQRQAAEIESLKSAIERSIREHAGKGA
jgi:hypothetical protein